MSKAPAKSSKPLMVSAEGRFQVGNAPDTTKRSPEDELALSGRIWDMSEALQSGEELTPAMRQEIRHALWILHKILWDERKARRRGAPKKREVWDAIKIAEDLFRKYDISFPAAGDAALHPNATTTVESVLRTRLDARKKLPRVAHCETYILGGDQIQQAVARLPKGTARRQK